ncbi:hypothetical protein jhhlp_004535 [Lomentospora prolificans]|uniref:Uncharacterized protein n=1 Tax=Lomentospora prolificans TaxID=41688 RepID=A0A2N3NC24_9PEZI|nr:hypothetical protein jhhlp_004535 [Lomentospora prolificans]
MSTQQRDRLVSTPSLLRLRPSIEPEAGKPVTTTNTSTSTASSRPATSQKISLRAPSDSCPSSPSTHPASRTTTLPKNSLASPKPRLPASAILSDGRSRHSIAPSSTIRSQRRPVTATATAISNSSTRRTTLSQTLSTTSNPHRRSIVTTRPPSSLSSVSSATNVSAVSSLSSTVRNATASSINKRNAITTTATTALRRAPLSQRDQNVHSGGMTRQQKTFTAKMAPDKGSGLHPRQPPLAASVAKGVSRTPLTPKIATSTHTTTIATTPRVAQSGATTPLARRTQPANHQATSTPSLRDEYASPISSFLSNNITPRSGSRQSRVDSNHNSPCGTPSNDKDAWDSRSGLGISAIDNDAVSRRPLAFSSANDSNQHHGNHSNHDGQTTADSKFFYASDAKGSQPKPPAQPARQGGPTFFYANGIVENRTNAPSPSPGFSPALGHTPENRASKFIYANGVPDLKPSHNQTASPRPPSVVSTASRMTTGRLNPGAMQQPTVQSQVPRPTSPVKMASLPSLTNFRTSGQSSLPTPSRPSAVSQASASPTVAATKRRVSFENGPPQHKGHSRSGSMVNAGAVNVAIESPPSAKGLSPPLSEVSTPASIGSPTIPVPPPLLLQLQTVEERIASDTESKHEAVYSELHSPTKATHSADQLTELIANARRERKVQDLEITNASLAAINRSLERRLRKQTTEIRRYRRLSRSGRLSIASAASTAASEAADSGAGMSAMSLSDLSEEEPEEESEEETDLSETDSGSESLSPEARAARDARHRQRDERRLQLDLDKHRELLVDSQKINQSLRKCLNWTEELIQEGRKALAYQVRVSDIKLGGRVLVVEDEEEDTVETDAGDDAGDDIDDITLDPDAEDTIHGARGGDDSDDSLLAKDEHLGGDRGVELPAEGS